MQSDPSSLRVAAVSAVVFVIALGSLAIAAPASPVRIDKARRSASGILGSRGDFDPIGCRVYRALGHEAAVCSARDAAGTQVECSTRNRELIDAAASREAGQTLTFTWNSSGTCTSVEAKPRASS